MPEFILTELLELIKFLSGQVGPLQFIAWGNWSFWASVERRGNIEIPAEPDNLNTSADKKKKKFGGGLLLEDIRFTPFPGAPARLLFKSVAQPFSWTTYQAANTVPAFTYKDGYNPPVYGGPEGDGTAYIPLAKSQPNDSNVGLTGNSSKADANFELTAIAEATVAAKLFDVVRSPSDAVLGSPPVKNSGGPGNDNFFARLDTTGTSQIEIRGRFQVDNYQFGHVYRFFADGRIECGVTLAGRLQGAGAATSHVHSLMFRFEIPQSFDGAKVPKSKDPMVVATLAKATGVFLWKRSAHPEGFHSSDIEGLRVIQTSTWNKASDFDLGYEYMAANQPMTAVQFHPADAMPYDVLKVGKDPVSRDFWVNSIKNEAGDFGAAGPWSLASAIGGAKQTTLPPEQSTDAYFLPSNINAQGKNYYDYDNSGVVVWYALRHLHVPNCDQWPIMPPESLSFEVRSIGTDPLFQPPLKLIG